MKILCLHGYTQNASVFKKKIAVLSKALEPNFETVFVDGPIVSTTSFKEIKGNEFAWWNSVTKGELHYYQGYQQSLDYIHEFIKNQGPFHGILGFSQGATMACLLASTMNPPPLFLIVCGGFIPRDPNLFPLRNTLKTVKSLHIMGERDELVPVEQSMMLVSKITESNGIELEKDVIVPITACSSILLHDGGHVFPCKSRYKKLILEWIHSVLQL